MTMNKILCKCWRLQKTCTTNDGQCHVAEYNEYAIMIIKEGLNRIIVSIFVLNQWYIKISMSAVCVSVV